MTSGIYAYWDNEKGYYAYIGKDSNIDVNKRYYEHKRPSMYDKQQINRVIQNNPDRYEYRVLMEGDYKDNQLNKMEKFLIKHLKTFKYDYPERSVFNFTKGGEGTSGRVVSDETRIKISEANKGKNNPNYGINYRQSDEHKRNISKSKNTTGYLNVSKQKNKRLKQGFTWVYQYYEDGKRKVITSIFIDKLEAKVKSKGLTWMKL